MLLKKSFLFDLVQRCSHTHVQSGLAKQDPTISAVERQSIQLPRKKTWSKNAILVSLSNAFSMEQCNNRFYPQTSVDLGSDMLRNRSPLHKAILHANSTVEFLKEREPNLLNIDWNVDSEVKAGVPEMPPIFPSAETSDESTVKESSSSVFNDLMAEKEFERLEEKYQELAKAGELSLEMKEKVFAFACYHSRHKNGLKLVLSILESTPPSNSYMFSVLLRGLAISKRHADVEKWFGVMKDTGFVPDVKTLNMVLGYTGEKSPDLFKSIIEVLKESQITPNAETIVRSERLTQHVTNTDQKIMSMARCLSEIDTCTRENRLDALISVLGRVSNKSAALALLLQLEKMQPRPVGDGHGFTRVMRYAVRIEDFALTERIVEATLRFNVVLPEEQYLSYVKLLGQHASAEKFFEKAGRLLGSVICDSITAYEVLVEVCSKRLWPQLLPGIHSFFDTSFMKPYNHTHFIRAAVKLVDLADAETRLQLKCIAFLFLNDAKSSRARVSPDFISRLCVMFAKYGEEGDLVTMLAKYKRYIDLLDHAAIYECYRVFSLADTSSRRDELVKLVPQIKGIAD